MAAFTETIKSSFLSRLRERFGRFELLAVQEHILVVRLAESFKGAEIIKLDGRWQRGKKEGLVLEYLNSLKGSIKSSAKGSAKSTFNKKEIPGKVLKKEELKNGEFRTAGFFDCRTILTPRLCFSYPLLFIPATGGFVESVSLEGAGGKEEEQGFKLWVLGMDDVRNGRDPRRRRLPRETLCVGAGILGCIHSAPIPEMLTQRNGWEAGWRHLNARRSSHELSSSLKKQLEKLVFIGDALCHNDLHPSNWITHGGRPVGLLDWTSAGVGDPESDLAGLLLATDVEWGGLSDEGDQGRRELAFAIDEVCEAWSSTALEMEMDMEMETSGKDDRNPTGRLADPVRVRLYMWLSVEEELLSIKRNSKDPGRISDLETLRELLAEELAQSSPCFGSLEKPRNACSRQMTVEKHELSGEDKKRITARWIEAQQEDVGLLWRALVREGVISDSGWIVEKFGRHACNDVVRFRRNHGFSDVAGYQSFVAKVYNKPLPPFLFPLEMKLRKVLGRSGVLRNARGESDAGIVDCEDPLRCVRVPSPVVLPSGRIVFRVGDRLALLYEDVGDGELDSTPATLRKVAMAQAALHSLGDEVRDLLRSSRADEPVYLDECLDVGRSLSKTMEEMDQLNEAVHWLRGQLQFMEKASDQAMVSTLVHGSLHRDHCLLSADGRIVVFDFEKASLDHRIKDAAITAYYMGYRSNSETLDPARIVAYLVHYSKAVSPGLSREESAFLVPYLLRAFFHDLRILPVEGREEKELRRHFLFLLDFFWNRNQLESVFKRVVKN